MPQKLLSLVSSVQSSEDADSLLDLESLKRGHIKLFAISHCYFGDVMFLYKAHSSPEIMRLFNKCHHSEKGTTHLPLAEGCGTVYK